MLKKYDGTNWNTASYGKYFSGTEQFTNSPVVIRSLDQSVQAYTIKGNTSASGTPSSVEIDGVGVKTANLFNYQDTTGIIDNSYINKNTGEIVSDNQYYISYPIPLEVGTTYTWRFNEDSANAHSAPTVGFYDSNDTLISVASHLQNIKYFSFTVPNNCAYIKASVYKYANRQKQAMLNVGNAPLDFEPYGYKISIYNNGTALSPMYLNNPLRKSLDGTAFDTLDSTGLVTYNVDKYGAPLVTPTTQSVTAPTISTATSDTTVISFASQVQPSEVSLTYNGKHLNKSKKYNGYNWT